MLPVSVTGDFARDYYYYFQLFYNPALYIKQIKSAIQSRNALSIVQQFTKIASDATLPYISQFAHSVTPPTDKLNVDALDIGGVRVPVPTSYELEQFSVVYFDDGINSVYNFHVGWQNSVREGWNFYLLYLCALSCVYGPGTKNPGLLGDHIIPTSVQSHPYIFPVQIKQSNMAAEGTNFREVTVTYIRLPRIVNGDSLRKKMTSQLDKFLKLKGNK